MSTHTKEPWLAQFGEVVSVLDENGVRIAILTSFTRKGLRDGDEVEANAHRIVACVNAMAGVEDPYSHMRKIGSAQEAATALHAQMERLRKSLENDLS